MATTPDETERQGDLLVDEPEERAPVPAKEELNEEERAFVERAKRPDLPAHVKAVGFELFGMRRQIANVLPTSVAFDDAPRVAARLMQRAILYLERKPDMYGFTPESFVRAVVAAAELGLALDGRLCYAIKYDTELQCVPAYTGLVAVARRDNVIVDATAYVVREGDQFELWEDEQGQRYKYVPDLDWSPKAGAPEDAGVRGAIAILRLPSGRNHCEWLPKRVLDDVRAKSKARKGEVPWKAWYDEMAKKTALRRALKTRQSIEGGEVPPVLGRALELHDAMYDLSGRRTVRTVSPTEEVRRVRGEPE